MGTGGQGGGRGGIASSSKSLVRWLKAIIKLHGCNKQGFCPGKKQKHNFGAHKNSNEKFGVHQPK